MHGVFGGQKGRSSDVVVSGVWTQRLSETIRDLEGSGFASQLDEWLALLLERVFRFMCAITVEVVMFGMYSKFA